VSEGTFREFLQKENNKRLKIFVENPQWKKMFVSLFVVCSDEANRLKCDIEELNITNKLMSATLKNMTWAIEKVEKPLEKKAEEAQARKLVLELTRSKTYTLQDILSKDLNEMSMMNPGSTDMFMSTMDRVLLVKGLSKAMKSVCYTSKNEYGPVQN
jgi:hypothetical protein